MPLMLAPMVGLIGLVIALSRHLSPAYPDARGVDVAARLVRWAVGLLPPQRAAWGQAMIGELDQIQSSTQRWRFAVGCIGVSLVLPPWGRAATAAWGLSLITVGGVGIHAVMALHYGLGLVDWLAVVIQSGVVIGLAVCFGALLRRPRVVVPGLLGGLGLTLTTLSLSGFSFLDQISPDTSPWHPWVITVAAPLVIGAVGTLLSADSSVGKRIARLAAISGSLALYLYWNIAVAVTRGGGPFDAEGGGTLRGTISDRLGNNLVLMLVIVTITATLGWAGAAATGTIAGRLFVSRSGNMPPALLTTSPQLASQAIPNRAPALRARTILLFAAVMAALTVGAIGWLHG